MAGATRDWTSDVRHVTIETVVEDTASGMTPAMDIVVEAETTIDLTGLLISASTVDEAPAEDATIVQAIGGDMEG